jgi:ATP-dependent exoDNAse (exonuclease V) alpha subunit
MDAQQFVDTPHTTIPLEPSEQQKEAITRIVTSQKEKKGSISFLTGKAGTGKSFTLKLLIEYLDLEGISTAVAAPTGTAALNVGGVTLHNLFSWKLEHTLLNIQDHKPFKCRGLKTLIIDEVSMVRADMMDMIDTCLRKIGNPTLAFGGTNLVLVGDAAQLPPVVSSTDIRYIEKLYASEFFYSSKIFKKLLDMGQVDFFCLTHVYRQSDTDFISLLDNIRCNSVSEKDLDILHKTEMSEERLAVGTILTKTNKQKDFINKKALHILEGETFTFDAKITGTLQDYQMSFAKKLELKVGSRVMAIKNIYDTPGGSLLVSNGDLGVVVGVDYDTVWVRLDRLPETPFPFSAITWEEGYNEYDSQSHTTKFKRIAVVTQVPLVLAFAVTVHKAQGQTLEQVTLDIRQGMEDSGMLYTAITRVRSLGGLKTLGRYNRHSFGVSPETVEFLKLVEAENKLV